MGRFEDTINSMIDIAEKRVLGFNSVNIINLLLPAYNKYIKDFENGDEYIYDMENKENIISLIKNHAPINGIKGFISFIQQSLANDERYVIVSNDQYLIYDKKAIIRPIELKVREILYNMLLTPSVPEYEKLYHEIFFVDMEVSRSENKII